MSFKFVKVSRIYDDFLWDYYSRYPYIGFCDYQAQFNHLMKQHFGWSDYHTQYLKEKGCTAHEIIANAGPLQKAWAREHRTTKNSQALVQFQIAHYSPDVVFLQFSTHFSAEWCEELRKQVPSIKMLIGWICSPFTEADIERLRGFDLILTCIPSIVKTLTEYGVRTEILNHGFDEGVLTDLNEETTAEHTEIPILFAGSLVQAKDFHYGRLDFLKQLAKEKLPLHISSELAPLSKLMVKKALGTTASLVNSTGLKKTFRYSPLLMRALQWQDVRLLESLKIKMSLNKHLKRSEYGMDFFKSMRNSLITLNHHIDFAGDYAGNARLFEATGVGSCLLTDEKKNIQDFFKPDVEIVTFKSTQDCIEKIRWLLNSPLDRERIAKAGQKRCLEQHTFRHRAEDLYHIIKKQI